MGRAIVREPKLFLFDEPLSNLDAKLRVQTRTQIADLQRRLGVTTVYVTHDQVEAMTLADRIVVMNKGVIEQIGSPGGVYDNPATAFSAPRDGYLNLFGSVNANSRAVLDFISSGWSHYTDESEVASANIIVQGPVFRLPGGDLKLAIGGQFRTVTVGWAEQSVSIGGVSATSVLVGRPPVSAPVGYPVYGFGRDYIG